MPVSQYCLAAFMCVASISFDARASDSIILDDAVRQQCLKVLRSGLHGDDFWPSIHAAEGLTLSGYGKEVVAFLTPKLPDENDDQRRCGISRELVRAGQRGRASVMLSILAGDDDYGHVHAAESLYKVVEIGDGVAMRRAFQQDENLRLKLMAAAALGRCGNPEAMRVLRSMLQHDDPEILRIAAWILGRIGDSSDIPRLRKELPRCEEELLRAYLHHSLAALGDEEGLRALAENLTNEDGAVRTYAATFAGDARDTSVADTLTHMLNDPHADAAIRAAQTLLFLSQPAAPDPAEDVSVVVYPSTKQNPRYTEGSVLPLRDGSLLFAATEFQGTGSDFAKAHIVGRRSVDGGRTWDASRVLQKNTGGMNVMSVTLRRLPGGQIAMFYLQKNSPSDLDLFVRISMDETMTFGESVLVTADDGYHVVNNDRIVQLSTGRLLAPAASTPDVHKVNHFVSHCYLSDDGGQTWRGCSGHVDAAKRGAMEPEVIELSDGRVMMIVRTQLGYIGRSYSSDGGDTWTDMHSLGVKAPEAPATLRRIPATGDLLLVWNNTFKAGAGHGGKRTPLTAAISSDEGRSWHNVQNLESDSDRTYSYTSLVFDRHRAVMSYWDSGEGDGALSCRFRSLPVSWFYHQDAVNE
ncbi:MAG: exo-alpha-sialidase [Fuerstiella sp.]|nr:exo-alpha-sialidase [Fuerstiella sp.]